MNTFEKYGLKEVANCTFYDIATKKPVLYLDTLKVSTIETTADNVEARGGWGNPALISWDYNKEVTVTLEDALFSPASLKVMMGADIAVATATDKALIQIVEEVTTDATGKVTLKNTPAAGTQIYYADVEIGDYVGVASTGAKEVTLDADLDTVTLNVFYTTEVDGSTGDAVTITINQNSFGGTYKVVGDTIVRSQITGKDEPFQFVIEKAKIQNEVTFTMEAEGDPATFNLPLRVLKDDKGAMFKMIKYNIA